MKTPPASGARDGFARSAESLASSLHQIGSAYQKLGNYGRAIDYCNQALAISIKAFGPIHINVAANYMTIGNLHGFMFNYKEAIRESHLVLQITHIDAMPITVMDSLAMARPVIVSNVGDMPDRIYTHYLKNNLIRSIHMHRP